jgi:integrase/recombinase XerD
MSMNDDGIYWRNGIAYGRVYFQGEEYRKSLGTRDPATARKAYAQWRDTFTPEGRLTFAQAVEHWEDLNRREAMVKPNTMKRYRLALRILASEFAQTRLADIDTKAIGRWVKLRKKGEVSVGDKLLKPATNANIRRDLTALSSVFRGCMALGAYHENPVMAWDRKVIPERRDPFYVPTVAQIEAVASECSAGLGALVRFAAYTGCRQAEAAALTWPNVRPERGEVRFMHTKTSKARVVALKSPGGDARASLSVLPRHIGVPYVFWHDLGTPYTSVSSLWRDAHRRVSAAEAKRGRALPYFNFHKLRHAFAIRWLEAGGDIYALSRHLGHTSVKTTEVYLEYIRQGYGGTDAWDEAEEAAVARAVSSA